MNSNAHSFKEELFLNFNGYGANANEAVDRLGRSSASPQGNLNSEHKIAAQLTIGSQSELPGEHSQISVNTTVLPFVYDGMVAKRGKSAVLRSQRSSAIGNSDRPRSFSLQDARNSNLNPRIASGKPLPEKRGIFWTAFH